MSLDRFWSKVDKSGECWLWTAGTRRGYGHFWVDGQGVGAHRWIFEQEREPIPEGMQLDHLCGERRCVRTSHLEIVDCRENLMRADTPARRNAAKDACPEGHAYSGENLYVRSSGARGCRACRRTATRRYRENRAAASA